MNITELAVIGLGAGLSFLCVLRERQQIARQRELYELRNELHNEIMAYRRLNSQVMAREKRLAAMEKLAELSLTVVERQPQSIGVAMSGKIESNSRMFGKN